MRGKRTGIALLLVVAVLSGCGSGGGTSSPGLTTGQVQGLVAELDAARAAAAAHNVAGTEAAIGRFRSAVARLRRAGALSDANARMLRIGAARVLARVKTDNATQQQPAATQTQTTPAPAPVPPGQKEKHKEEKHKEGKPGKDHGKGHADGEGGD